MAAAPSNVNAPLMPGANQSITTRMGRGAAELSRPCFTAGSSRVARSRAAKAVGLRKRKPVSPQSPPSPNQESAVNPRTGKVAFGPWLGPYETHNDATAASEPLFLDHQGNTYASLTSSIADLQGVPKPANTDYAARQQQPQRQLSPEQQLEALAAEKAAAAAAGGGAEKAAAAAATRQLYALVSKVVQRQALAAQGHSGKPFQWPGRGKPHGSGRCSGTMARAINQPRRS